MSRVHRTACPSHVWLLHKLHCEGKAHMDVTHDDYALIDSGDARKLEMEALPLEERRKALYGVAAD